jgi:hypothetical protein
LPDSKANEKVELADSKPGSQRIDFHNTTDNQQHSYRSSCASYGGISVTGDKGKVHPRTDYENPEGE